MIALFSAEAPRTVQNFVQLARDGFYAGTRIHRIIPDFMIQGGDPVTKSVEAKARWGTGGPGYQFADEINARKLARGSLAMANAGPDTNGSQWFIVTASSTPWLDGKHTNFGQVTAGMEVVQTIAALPTDDADRPLQDVIVERVEITPALAR